MARILALVWMCLAAPGWADPLRLGVSASLRPFADAVAERYDGPGAPIQVSSAATGVIFAQVQAGAPFDLVILAEMARPAQLAGPDRPMQALMRGRLVIWSDQGADLYDLPAPVAIANPQLAPYGAAAMQVLHATGQAELPVVTAANAAQAAGLAATGNAPVAFIAASLAPQRGQVQPVPQELYDPIWHAAVLLDPRGAVLWEWLQGAPAQGMMREAGFDVE